MPQYKEIEHNLMLLIAKEFGFEYPLVDEVKAIDKAMLEYEWSAYMLENLPNKLDVGVLHPIQAKKKFLEELYDIYVTYNNYTMLAKWFPDGDPRNQNNN